MVIKMAMKTDSSEDDGNKDNDDNENGEKRRKEEKMWKKLWARNLSLASQESVAVHCSRHFNKSTFRDRLHNQLYVILWIFCAVRVKDKKKMTKEVW